MNKWGHSIGKIQVTPRATEPEPDPPEATPAAKGVTGQAEPAVNQFFSIRRHMEAKMYNNVCVLQTRNYKVFLIRLFQIKTYSSDGLAKVGVLIDSCLFTRLLCSKQRDPVFNAGKKRLLYGCLALMTMCFPAMVQLIESHYIKDAQWFSVSVGGQCIFFRNPVKIQNYVFTFLFIPKRKQCKRCLELFSVPRRPLTANTQCFVLVFIFSIISSLTSNKHPTSSSSNCHLSFFFL